MTRAARPWLIGVVLAALLLGGCGIPDDTPVLTVGPGPSMGTSAGGDVAPTQHSREDAADRQAMVQYYLEAAAGDPDDALKRVRAFLSPSAAAAFTAPSPSDIRVVHPFGTLLNNPGSEEVTMRYQVVGILRHNGILEPTADGTIERVTMVVAAVAGKPGLFLTKVPPYLMISDTALSNFYDQHAIYFWNTEHTGLVPDMRYLPLTVPAEQQPTMILNWLVDGPADWLNQVVDRLPEDTTVKGNVPAQSNGNLQINLSDQAVPPDDARALDRLRRQLQWSLRPLLPKTLELTIGRADPTFYSDADYLTSNFGYRLAESPERFVVFDQRVRRLAGSSAAAEPIPVILPAENRNVRTAALSKSDSEDFAALVVNEPNGKQSLRVGSARPGQQAPLTKVSLPAPIGHPTWSVTPATTRNDAIGLVAAKGALYSFTPEGNGEKVDWAGAPAGITAVSIAPDGHRVAVLAGGQLYLTALTTSGDGIQLSGPVVPIHTLLLQKITAVDWSSEGWLAVAGVLPPAEESRVNVMDMTIDGAKRSDRVSDLGDEPVTYLTAYPANPTTSQHTDLVSYVAGSAAYDASHSAARITVSELAEPVTNPSAGAVPTAPFFLN